MIPINIDEAIVVLKPLAVFVLGMFIYSLFIFKFYKFIAKKDVFKLDLEKHNKAEHPLINKTINVIFYIIEYVLFFPVFAFFWFGMLTILLSLLSRSQTVQQILLVSMSLVGAVRIAAYYNEDLSRDLAKMFPFALLGIFIVDNTYFTFTESITIFKEIIPLWNILLYYLIFTVALEFLLRIGYGIGRSLAKE